MSQSNPLISIVLPVFNAANYLLDTVESILSQSYQNWELLIVDDCSSDGSWKLIQHLQKGDLRIQAIQLDSNSGGPALPRNTGIEKAKGDLLAFIDSDDVWHKDKLQIQLEQFLIHGMDFSCTQISVFQNTIEDVVTEDLTVDLEEISLPNLLKINLIPLSTVLAKKELFDENRFSSIQGFVGIEDYELWLRIHSRVVASFRLSVPLTHYRLREDSLSASKLKMLLRRLLVLNKFKINGKGLGWRKYYYLCCYVVESLLRRAN